MFNTNPWVTKAQETNALKLLTVDQHLASKMSVRDVLLVMEWQDATFWELEDMRRANYFCPNLSTYRLSQSESIDGSFLFVLVMFFLGRDLGFSQITTLIVALICMSLLLMRKLKDRKASSIV